MYVRTHIYTYCMCVCIYIYIYICIHTHTHTHTHIYIYCMYMYDKIYFKMYPQFPPKIFCSTIWFFICLKCILVHKLLINHTLCVKNTHPDYVCKFVHIHLHSIQVNFYSAFNNAYCFKAAIENACFNVSVNMLVNILVNMYSVVWLTRPIVLVFSKISNYLLGLRARWI